MTTLSFDQLSYTADGARTFLRCAEVHLFRVAETDWRDRLLSVKAAGYDTVSTLAPWQFAEPEEGRFDNALRESLGRFIDLCGELGLRVMVRPGPYQYSEMQFEGLPTWLCANHPELLAHNLEGKSFREGSISYLHPEFLRLARRFLDYLAPVIAARTTSRGGPVCMVQVDNELIGMHEWFGTWDYNADSLGIGREEGRWPSWLRQRHGDVKTANAVYGTSATTWAELRPITTIATGATGERLLVKDYQAFYFGSIAEYAGIVAGWLRAAGVDCLLCHNSGNPYMNAYFEQTVKALGEGFVLGSDHYYNLSADWDQNNPTPKHAIKVMTSLEQLRAYGHPPTVFELPGGSPMDWPVISAHDIRCSWMLNLAYGMKGWNTYIVAGGPNPPGSSKLAAVYDYNAAIEPDGTRNELWQAQRDFHALLDRAPWLAAAERACDVRFGLLLEDSRASRTSGGPRSWPFNQHEAWNLLHKGPLPAAMCLGMQPELIVLDLDERDIPTDLPLVICCGQVMAERTQRKLVRFLDQGGRLLALPLLPELDERLRPCRVLAERVGVTVPARRFTTEMILMEAYTMGQICIGDGLIELGLPAGATPIAWERRSGAVCGYEQRFAGGGAITVLGQFWTHGRREQEQLLATMLRGLGHVTTVRGGSSQLWTVVRCAGERVAFFAFNLFSGTRTGRWSFTHPATGATIDTGSIDLAGISAAMWTAEAGWTRG